MVHIYYGNGKGKTTSAIGLSIRCAGSGGKVLFVQFLKDNNSSERKILDKIENITLYPCPESIKFLFNMTEEEKINIREFCTSMFIHSLNSAISKNYDMIILDEINCVIDNNLININLVKQYIGYNKDKIEIVLTGYALPDDLIDLADYISKIDKIKHPFDNGVNARLGIEY